MLHSLVRTVLLRDLAAVRRSVLMYPDDASIWTALAGLPNAGGTLALHVAGNLQHYLGAVLGGSGYVRDRDTEFARRDVSRAELLAELDAAAAAVDGTLARLDGSAATLASAYPERIGDRELSLGSFLVHLATHLAYHLGQLDYHRRAVTGEARGVGAVAAASLPSFADG